MYLKNKLIRDMELLFDYDSAIINDVALILKIQC